MNIKKIIEAILDYRFWITDHADEEAEEDQLSFDEIYHSVLYGEIIEAKNVVYIFVVRSRSVRVAQTSRSL